MKTAGILLGLALGGLTVACGNEHAVAEQEVSKKQDEETSVGTVPVESLQATPRGSAPPAEEGRSAPSPGAGLQRLVDLATKDLSATIGVEYSEVQLFEADFVTWRDSSLGCPQPGYQYTQALTNGSRIVLRADGQDFHYHSGGNRSPFHCKNPSKVGPLPYAHGEA